MTKLQGLGTALITPFTEDENVDYEALGRMIEMQVAAHVDYLVVLGTTGEAATLTDEEHATVRRFIVRQVAGRLPLVLGVGGNCTRDVIHRLHAWHDELLHDYTAILSVCPYYNKPNQEGIYQHFIAVAEASPIPVILYNVPGRTGINMLPETIMRIWETHPDKVYGIKEASGDIEQIKRLINLTRNPSLHLSLFAGANVQPLQVISGDDGLAVEVMLAGGAGLISVLSNIYPADTGQMVRHKDKTMQTDMQHLISLLFQEGNPVGIKAALNIKGLIHNTLRLPLVPASDNLMQSLNAQLKNTHA